MNTKKVCCERIYYVHCYTMQNITALCALASRHRIWIYVGKYRLELKDAMDFFTLNFDNDIMLTSIDDISEELQNLNILVM